MAGETIAQQILWQIEGKVHSSFKRTFEIQAASHLKVAKAAAQAAKTTTAAYKTAAKGLGRAGEAMKRLEAKSAALAKRMGEIGRPGGVGGVLANLIKMLTKLALLPLRILSGFAKLIPGIGGILGSVVGAAANVLQGLVAVAANVVGGIVNAFGKLVMAIGRIFERVVGVAAKILGKLPGIILKLGLAATAASAGLFLLVRSSAKLGDELAKTAKRTGISVKGLSELTHVAGLADASITDILAAVRGLGRAIEGASRGAGEYVEIFTRLGMSFKDVGGKIKPTEVLFWDAVKALKAVENDTLRAGIAQKLMGRSAMALLPLIKMSTEELKAARQEAHRLGVVWSDQAAVAAERFMDALWRLQGAWRSLKRALAVPLFEPLTKALNDFAFWAASHRKIVQAFGETLAKAFKTAVPVAVKLILKLQKAIAATWNYLTTRDWSKAWKGLLEAPRRLVTEVLPGFVKLFVQKVEGAWKIGPLLEGVLAGVKWLTAQVLIVVDKLWEQIRAHVLKGVSNILLTTYRVMSFRMPRILEWMGLKDAVEGILDAADDLDQASKKTGGSLDRIAERTADAALAADDLKNALQEVGKVGATAALKAGEALGAAMPAVGGVGAAPLVEAGKKLGRVMGRGLAGGLAGAAARMLAAVLGTVKQQTREAGEGFGEAAAGRLEVGTATYRELALLSGRVGAGIMRLEAAPTDKEVKEEVEGLRADLSPEGGAVKAICKAITEAGFGLLR